MVPSIYLLLRELLVSAKESTDRKQMSFASYFDLHLKLLSSEVVFFSKEANQTIEFSLLDVMTIPHIFIKDL